MNVLDKPQPNFGVQADNLRWAYFVRVIWEHDLDILLQAERDQSRISQLDESLFNILTGLAGIPPGPRGEQLRLGIDYAIDRVCWKWSLDSAPRSRFGSNKRASIELRKLAKYSRELLARTSKLDNQTLRYLLFADTMQERGIPVPHDTDLKPLFGKEPPPGQDDWLRTRWPIFQKSLTEFASISGCALSLQQLGPAARPIYEKEFPLQQLHSAARPIFQKKFPPLRPAARRRGRPSNGQFSKLLSGSLVEFTFHLLLAVRAAGGRLSIDKNAGRGSLLDALGLLRPHLPRNFVPRRPPLSTLALVMALDRKIAVEVGEQSIFGVRRSGE